MIPSDLLVLAEDKMSGVSLPCFSVVVSVVVGVLVLVASGSRSRFMLKYIGGAPNRWFDALAYTALVVRPIIALTLFTYFVHYL